MVVTKNGRRRDDAEEKKMMEGKTMLKKVKEQGNINAREGRSLSDNELGNHHLDRLGRK